MNISKDRDNKITEGFETLKANEGLKAGCHDVNVRTSVGVRTFAIAVLFILILVQAAQAGDWPMRGHDPEHSGVADEIVKPPLKLLWKYTTESYVRSSPAVSGGVVYVGSDDHKVYALYTINGTQKWNFTTGNLVESSPAVSGGVVYVGSYDNNVYALDASTGALKWKFPTGSAVESSPTVSDGVVYVGSDDKQGICV